MRDRSRTRAMLEDVINLHRSGRLDEAESGYRQWLAENPDDAGALHLLGILRGQRGDVAGALQLVARASELDPDNAACRHTLGEMYLSANRLDEAAQAYDEARQLNPNLAAAHAGLGHVALLRGDLDAAENHFKVALRADENDTPALTGLGNVAQARGDSARALQLLTQAAEGAPDNPLIQASYARAMLDQGMPDFAGKALDNALAVRPGYALAQVLRADVHVQKGEFAAATQIYESLLAHGEQVPAVRTGLGDIARAQGRHADAIAQYDEALRLQPALDHAAIRRADALARSGRVAQAIVDMQARLAASPDNVRVYIGLARLLTQVGRHDEALAVWTQAEARWPQDLNVRAQHALALDSAGHTAEALAWADRAAASPRPAIAMLRARGALLAGDPAAALQRLQRIEDQHLQDKPPQVARRRQRLLGLAFDRLEQWPEAVAAFLHAPVTSLHPLPELATLDDATRANLTRLAAGAPLADAAGPAPIFLCGLPGSGVEQVAAWLATQAGVHVRRERFASAPDFISADFDPRLGGPLDQATLALLARRYRRARERTENTAAARVIDWIPALDVRVVPALKLALPGARVLRVARDSHDTLLNWLAFGWMRGFALTDPLDAARWLRLAHAHLDFATTLLPSHSVDVDALSGAPGASARTRLSAFLELPALAADPAAEPAMHGRDGLPLRFAPGHARHYRECLPEPFAALDDMLDG